MPNTTDKDEEDWEFIKHEEASPPPPSPPSSTKTFSTIGKGERILKPNQQSTLLYHHTTPGGDGGGCLTHFWFGGNYTNVQNTHIRYYINDEIEPSIHYQLYLGHGIGFGDDTLSPWATKFVGKIGKRNGIYNNYYVPFGFSIRVTAERVVVTDDEEEEEEVPESWWIVRGLENGRVNLSGLSKPLLMSTRLYLYKIEEELFGPLEEFDLCKVKGCGALFQVMIMAQSTSFSYLEGCMRAYDYTTDDDDDKKTTNPSKKPMMLSSGLEDYFLGTYYFDTGLFTSDISGLTHYDASSHSYSAYRFHDVDPIVFENGLRLTCRCGETEHGTEDGKAYMNPQPTRYTTYAWVYQW